MKTAHVFASTLIAAALGAAVAIAQSPAAPAQTLPTPNQAPATQPPPAPSPAAAGAPQGGPPTPAPLPPALTSCPELAAAIRNVAANDARMRDWPNMARYRDANKTAGPVDVVFMGDSITDAWFQPRFGGFPGKAYAGRGISGQTTPQMVLRFRSDVLNLKPKAVVILAGTNDIAGNTGPMTDEEIEGHLATMSELAAGAGVKVILSSILPVASYHVAGPNGVPQTIQRPPARVRAINDWMKAYAARNKHIYLDYYSAMIDAHGMLRSELSTDDLHPVAAGYAIMAPLAQAAIDKALGK
jgi:lysophospholipase L1-like esterase